MRARIREITATFGWWQWLLAGVFLFALLATGLFAVRTTQRAIFWRLHQNEPIERWMTLRYVSHSYRVPPDVLYRALGLEESRPPARPDRRPLGEIATAQGKTFEAVKATLERAIASWQPPDPPGPPGGPPKGTPPPSDTPRATTSDERGGY